jgi:uncharacterized protein (TIGR02246 family)
VEEVRATIIQAFEALKRCDAEALAALHADDGSFTKFAEFPPYGRQDRAQALLHEEIMAANLTDYEYRIEDLQVVVLGGVAVATFLLTHRAVLVNDYTFEGHRMELRVRATMVLKRQKGMWRIVHEHFSPFPTHPARDNSPK